MGDRWHLLLGNRQVRTGRNHTPAKLMTVFQEEDKYMHVDWARRADELNASTHEHGEAGEETGQDEECEYNDGEESDEEFADLDRRELFGYRASIQTITTRLALMGFSTEWCRQEMAEEIEELKEDDDEDGVLVIRHRDAATHGTQNRYRLSGEELVDIAVKAYMKQTGKPFWISSADDSRPELTELERLCLDEMDFYIDDLEADPRMFLGLILRGQDPQAVLQLDLSDLLVAGYFESTKPVSAEALQQLRDETASSGPIIVITEGKFDSRVLARALRVIRPDVAGYFKFWDPDGTKAAGGTDRVVANLRSFAAAGVMNRVIGLVDNDAAGLAAQKIIANPALPRNYTVRRLPDLDYTRAYPTLGPSGPGEDDINGRACSVEFYFGSNCLLGPDGSPIPVQWTAQNPAVGQWQGELWNKKYVQARVEAFLDAAEKAGSTQLDASWEPLRQIAEILIEAAQPPVTPR